MHQDNLIDGTDGGLSLARVLNTATIFLNNEGDDLCDGRRWVKIVDSEVPRLLLRKICFFTLAPNVTNGFKPFIDTVLSNLRNT